jgi:thiamine biosynthesis lipoprotein
MPLMGTTITIKVNKPSDVTTVDALDLIEQAFGEFQRIVKQFTRFNDDSELSNLNRRSGEWTQIGAEFFMLIQKMLDLAAATNGAFDPTVIDFLEVYGYDKNYDFNKLNNPDLDKFIHELARTRPNWKAIEIDVANQKVKLAPKQRLDLGGIGKGYAVDLAARTLAPLANFLIDAGGDIYGHGVNLAGEPWLADLRHQTIKRDARLAATTWSPSSEVIGYMQLENCALACSGSWARKVKQFHHLINPLSGTPAQSAQTVFVKHPDATVADGWATAIFVLGKQGLPAIKLPSGLEFMIIDHHNWVTASEGFKLETGAKPI